MARPKTQIECFPDYDETGRWCLRLRKSKGHFTLDEIQETLTAWEWDFYAVIIRAIEGDGLQYYEDYMDSGDAVTAYRATDFLKKEDG